MSLVIGLTILIAAVMIGAEGSMLLYRKWQLHLEKVLQHHR